MGQKTTRDLFLEQYPEECLDEWIPCLSSHIDPSGILEWNTPLGDSIVEFIKRLGSVGKPIGVELTEEAYLDIDPELHELIRVLNKYGLRTYYSCSGHQDRPASVSILSGGSSETSFSISKVQLLEVEQELTIRFQLPTNFERLEE